MNQSRLSSFYEACFGTAIGFFSSMLVGRVLYPSLGWDITLTQSFIVTGIYTVVSIIRTYAVRRWFNARLQRAARKLAGL